jgi:hypothetical protein
MSDKNKYICEKCNFKCNSKISWNKHIETEKHKIGKNKIRSDKIYPCKCIISENCNFIATKKSHMDQHILMFHSTKEERKANYKYYCDYCDFGSLSEVAFNKHLLSNKHKNFILIKS